ncbi:phosphate acyltransferase PlsX [Clostridium saccharoperbutylacetonicum]|uniref:Phosphate acyltransferase n=1 Tax=Clostridium saccharoperbutylacetonicum N1-4(HMT) TaxID=931276 RepID=M1MU51_9CLOT|nr:phosphate acyltransferase PlsX [Clostridium saccharoperbutylacetonicum]AGF55077.1 phosphate acyltransferase PlsX [Clostridium saccharoperbutylacetonicum N1-4(HMT)]AQR93966.1 phosphate acyltransferase [Clostridium saccharoperbutylacetonicum]NRT64214.1 glycerol-3-phosphate acyltransferase PlsX [Clostridium saccharoperbutylacetonicum]NSB27581.1 glycerol-3-phosphate acyltransferase PlsX [Clostridium saccharoperbutylacetonicum]NSB29665.1 glycerol-3-phosphate acyltransferase PlsX [Clostridium sac
MKIAIDGMGGDNAPVAVVQGAIDALKEYDNIELYITGPEELINAELEKYTYSKEKINVIDAKEVISPNEHPVMALRKKKDSSIVKALELVKDGVCDAIISGGSTGAFLAGCTLTIGRIKGVERPALAPIMPGRHGSFMIVDVGANVDCKPQFLMQFAKMGKIYYEKVFDVKNPSVGLINIGEEEEKGNELTKAAFKLLKEEKNINFKGNVEPREIPGGNTNVLVCDGFVGNTALKMYEGSASSILGIIKDEVLKSSITSKLGILLLKPVLKNCLKKFDYKEYGGAPFLGVNGICIKAHGSSDGKAFKNAIRQTKIFYEKRVLEDMKNEFCSEN